MFISRLCRIIALITVAELSLVLLLSVNTLGQLVVIVDLVIVDIFLSLMHRSVIFHF